MTTCRDAVGEGSDEAGRTIGQTQSDVAMPRAMSSPTRHCRSPPALRLLASGPYGPPISYAGAWPALALGTSSTYATMCPLSARPLATDGCELPSCSRSWPDRKGSSRLPCGASPQRWPAITEHHWFSTGELILWSREAAFPCLVDSCLVLLVSFSTPLMMTTYPGWTWTQWT